MSKQLHTKSNAQKHWGTWYHAELLTVIVMLLAPLGNGLVHMALFVLMLLVLMGREQERMVL